MSQSHPESKHGLIEAIVNAMGIVTLWRWKRAIDSRLERASNLWKENR